MKHRVYIVAGMAAAGLIVLLSLVLIAAREASVAEGFRVVLAEWWGVVAIVDLYFGLLVVAGWISIVEQRKAAAFVWLVALLCLGNIATMAYVLLRARQARSLEELILPVRRAMGSGLPTP